MNDRNESGMIKVLNKTLRSLSRVERSISVKNIIANTGITAELVEQLSGNVVLLNTK